MWLYKRRPSVSRSKSPRSGALKYSTGTPARADTNAWGRQHRKTAGVRRAFLTAKEMGGYTAFRGNGNGNGNGNGETLWVGLACCAIEMIASTTARFDMAVWSRGVSAL